MKIPERTKKLFRKHENAIFFSSRPQAEKIYDFYLLTRPLLTWVIPELRTLGLESDEIVSELYLLSASIFLGFDREKSSVIPYLEKYIPWHAAKVLRRLKKQWNPQIKVQAEGLETEATLDEDFYWRMPGILFEDRWVGKCFTRAEKYLISIVLMADDSELSIVSLAAAANVDRKKITTMLSDMKAVLIGGHYDPRS